MRFAGDFEGASLEVEVERFFELSAFDELEERVARIRLVCASRCLGEIFFLYFYFGPRSSPMTCFLSCSEPKRSSGDPLFAQKDKPRY